MNRIIPIIAAGLVVFSATQTSMAVKHTVIRGDTMWKIASQYKVGTKEIIQANPQVHNPDLIFPGEILEVPQISSYVRTYEERVVELVNQHRSRNGLSPLSINWELSRVARIKSQDMADNRYFSHNSPTYGTPFQMMKSFGIKYNTAGENIAYGQATPEEVVSAWMNSTGHRQNILNNQYTQIGIGYFSKGNYWTQLFIG